MNVLKVPVEVYSRVSGYFRPVAQWNYGKQEEFTERKMLNYEVNNISEPVIKTTIP
jgi:ribonucleoside-triphosphate reductase (formate)